MKKQNREGLKKRKEKGLWHSPLLRSTAFRLEEKGGDSGGQCSCVHRHSGQEHREALREPGQNEPAPGRNENSTEPPRTICLPRAWLQISRGNHAAIPEPLLALAQPGAGSTPLPRAPTHSPGAGRASGCSALRRGWEERRQ